MVDNRAIAQRFRDIADLLNIQGENFFRVRAYSSAAETLENLPRPAADYLAAGEDLTQFEGIGKDLSAKIKELVETGKLEFLDRLGADTPRTLLDIMRLPGVGPKRTKQIFTELDVVDLRGLEKAAREGRLSQLPRLGTTLESRILEQVRKRLATGDEQRLPWREAFDLASGIMAHLKGLRGIGVITAAGSLRRFRENVGDLDILCTAKSPHSAMERFVGYTRVSEIVSRGDTRSTVRLGNGFQVDLRVVPEESFGAALQYFTGSKAHNIALRKRAVRMGFKLNEYGLYRDDLQLAGRTEEDVYRALGLAFIEPELRENMGEVESAGSGNLPNLVTLEMIRGEVRCRTARSGARGSLREMVAVARKRGLKYLVLAEPTRGVEPRTGLSPKQFASVWKEIAEVQTECKGFSILRGVEAAIGEDGTLDLPRSLLEEAEVVIGSAIPPFSNRESQNTKRLLRAVESGAMHIIAHLAGRLLPERQEIPLDLKRVLEAAAAAGIAVEINGRPEYTDLSSVHCRVLRETGAKAVVTGDARSPSQFPYLDIAVGQARRGWVSPETVLNSLSKKDFLAGLRRPV